MSQFFAILIVLILYFLPTIIAVNRQHQSSVAIFLINLFLSFTFIGWVWAFLWSLGRPIPFIPQQNVIVQVNQPNTPQAALHENVFYTPEQVHEKMTTLTTMKEKGWLTEEEFEAKRVAILEKMQ